MKLGRIPLFSETFSQWSSPSLLAGVEVYEGKGVPERS